MMNTAYFDHSSTANGFYNSAAAEAHQAAYRSFSQSALSLMPSAATVASAAYASSASNLRTGQSSVSGSNDGSVTSNYVDAACKLYDGNQAANQAAAAAAAAAAFKSECSLSKSDQNGFKAPDHQMASAWQSSLRPSPSSAGMTTPDMRSFDAAAAACSRSVTDAWSACCNGSMNTASMGAPPNTFYPWMAIAGKKSFLFTKFKPQSNPIKRTRNTTPFGHSNPNSIKSVKEKGKQFNTSLHLHQ